MDELIAALARIEAEFTNLHTLLDAAERQGIAPERIAHFKSDAILRLNQTARGLSM